MLKIEILDLTPKGRYADGSPYYNFHNPFPQKRPTVLPEVFSTPEKAYEHGRKYVVDYERGTFPGGMGAVLGVVNDTPGEYRAVISTYYSFS